MLTDPSKPLELQELPIPDPKHGTALLRVLAAPVLSYASEVFQKGNPREYPYPLPMVPGPSSCIARVEAVASDAVKLKPGTLVWVDATVTARDDPEAIVLQGLFEGLSDASRALMRSSARDGNMAEFVTAPLENVHILNEDALLGQPDGSLGKQKFGYTVADLAFLFWLLVPYGGLRDVSLRPGETVIVAPATGPFGGVAVLVALAMGAGRVIAMGRNTDALHRLRSGREDRVETVRITGDVDKDAAELCKFGLVDVYFDISPPQAAGSTHMASAFRALKRGARVSLMGGITTDVALPHVIIMQKDITIKGSKSTQPLASLIGFLVCQNSRLINITEWMYPMEAVPELVRMIERGMLRIGPASGIEVARYGLHDWEKAFKDAESSTFAKFVVFEQ